MSKEIKGRKYKVSRTLISIINIEDSFEKKLLKNPPKSLYEG